MAGAKGRRQHATVMGGSLGGLSASIALGRAGFDVDVYERSPRPLEGRGAGIVLHPATARAIPVDPEVYSSRVVRLRYLDREGHATHELACSYRFSSYVALHAQLLAATDPDRYHLGQPVAGFTQSADGVTVELGNGAFERTELLVCADGIGSMGRRALLPDVATVYAGYVGWRGTVVESELSPGARDALRDSLCYSVLPSSHMLAYPIPAADDSSAGAPRTVNWVWYRNVAEGVDLERLLSDRHGRRHPVSLAPGAVPSERVDELRRSARETLPWQLAEAVEASTAPFVQAVFDVVVPRMAFGCVALVGDAAFVVRPHVAAGTAKAAEDAWTLGAALAETPHDRAGALARWEARQLRLGAALVRRARGAGIRSQFEQRWRAGDALPFGLHAAGDSRMA